MTDPKDGETDEAAGDPRGAAGIASPPSSDGICAELGALPPGALITEGALAKMLGKSARSVKRAVDRGELPPPVRVLGEFRWTAGAVVRHVEKRLDAVARRARKTSRRIRENLP